MKIFSFQNFYRFHIFNSFNKKALNDHSRQQYLTFIMPKIIVSFLLVCVVLLSGCQSLSLQNFPFSSESQGMSGINNNINYTQYYLSLTKLSEEQLVDEIQSLDLISTEKENKNINDHLLIESQLKSVLLYALPQSTFHSPFTAKSKLNRLSLEKLKNKALTAADFAFFKMLKIQLNQQIILLNQLIKEKKSHKELKQAYLEQELEFQTLKQQIIQLKKIEKNINEHGQ